MKLDDRIAALEKRLPPSKRELVPRETLELDEVLAEIDAEAARLASMDQASRSAHWRAKIERYEDIIAAGGAVDGDDWHGVSPATLEMLRRLRVEIAHSELPELRSRLAEAEAEGE